MVLRRILLLLVTSLVAFGAHGQRSIGNYSANPYDPHSTANPYGAGNPYDPNSIRNPYGQYGNPYSPSTRQRIRTQPGRRSYTTAKAITEGALATIHTIPIQ